MYRATTIILVVLYVNGTEAASPEFGRDVAPILNKYCVGCHSGEDAESGLALDSYGGILDGGDSGPAIDLDDPNQSALLAHVIGSKEPVMPPVDEPQMSKAELATLVRWFATGANGSSGSTGRPRFDSLPSSESPGPVTAMAFRPGDGRLVLVGDADVLGVEIKSKHGLLVPMPQDEPVPAPFKFVLSNTKSEVTFGSIGGVAKLRGELKLPIGFAGVAAQDDLTVVAGGPNAKRQPLQVRVDTGVAVGTFGTVELSDGLVHEPTHVLKTPGKVLSLRFSSDGASLLAASGVAGVRGEALLWSADDGEVLQRFVGHSDAIYSAELSMDGKIVATCSYDRTIILWDASTGSKLRTLKGHNGAVYDVAFSPDARVLASASADATVKIWNVTTGERLDTLSQPLEEQYVVDISPDGRFIVAGGEDNRIRMWRLESIDEPRINPLLHAKFAHEGAIRHVRFSADGSLLISSADDGALKVWETENMRLSAAAELPQSASQALAMSSAGDMVAVGRTDGMIASLPLPMGNVSVAENENTTQVQRRVAQKESATLYDETEPNDRASTAMAIEIPATISGRISSPREAVAADEDVFQFSASAGEEWIIEVKAARDGSPLDSFVSILQKDGSPLPRIHLQATRDSYFTFRGKDSNGTGDFRLHNWEEMRLNQLLYCGGEVVKLYHYPRGPDSGFNVYPNFGSRRGYFDTTPTAHALHEPCYIVEPHPPGIELTPNGLPVFTLNYENDDDALRRWGSDSRLTFVAPRSDDYFVAIRDVTGAEGEDFKYQLMIRPPRRDFKGKLIGQDPEVAPGTGKKIGIEVERIDGFDGPIDVQFTNLPDGFFVQGPLQIEAGHDRLWATLIADEDAKIPSEEDCDAVSVLASASIDGQRVEHLIGSLGEIKLTGPPKLDVVLVPDHPASQGESELPVIELSPGSTTTATIRIVRHDHEGRVRFGSEDSAVNAPHGVYVDNIGLNGVLIVEGQHERQFFITAESWVKPTERVIFVEESGDVGGPTSNPVLLRILPPEQADSD